MVIRLINSIFKIMELIIFIEVILSWIMVGKKNEFTMIVHKITAPLLEPGRKIQEKIMPGLMIDFSPIIALLIINLLRRIIISLLLF